MDNFTIYEEYIKRHKNFTGTLPKSKLKFSEKVAISGFHYTEE